MSAQRKFTATVKEPPNAATTTGYELAFYLEELDSNPSFGGRHLIIDLRPETTVEQADELARQLNRLGVSVSLR